MSPSSVGTFNQCPMRFKFSKLDKIKEPSTEAQVIGSFVHEILEHLYAYDQDERTLSNARSIAKHLWYSKWLGEYEDLDEKSDINEFRWKSWWCVENYFELEDPTTLQPSGLETKVNGDIDGVPIFGIVDRWHIEDGKIVVSDYKTGKKPKKAYEWEKKLQIMIYVDLLEKEVGVDAEYGELIYLKSPNKVRYEATPELRESVSVTLRNTWDEVITSCNSGEFECRTGPLCNWCNFKNICPAWSKS